MSTARGNVCGTNGVGRNATILSGTSFADQSRRFRKSPESSSAAGLTHQQNNKSKTKKRYLLIDRGPG
jgi:hypothetical protein